MEDQEYFNKEFNEEFKDGIGDYALLKGGEVEYTVINVKRQSMIVFERREMGEYFAKRLLALGIKVYNSTSDIPGWGSREKERPPELNPL